MRVGSTDSVVAVDIYPEQFSGWSSMDSLPEGSRYFLFDSQGFLLHYNGFDKSEISDFDSYTEELFSEIKRDFTMFPLLTLPIQMVKSVAYTTA